MARRGQALPSTLPARSWLGLIATNAGNSITSAPISLTGGVVAIVNTGLTVLGNIATTGALTVTTTGAGSNVDDSGTLKIGGLLTITADAGSASITLSAGNTYSGGMNLAGNPVVVN